jgi:antitoxin VapB
MPLNIKNAVVEEAARDVAALTGESLTEAVGVALQERLERLRARGMAERIMEHARFMAPRLRNMADPDTLLYDEVTGLWRDDR